MSYKKLGDLIQLVDVRNKGFLVKKLLGINITKNFMPSKANVGETDLSKYKVIKKGQFAFSSMQVGRDETVRVVLYTSDELAIISPAYSVFEVSDQTQVFPEFLMLWFYRPEFNRYGWFISDSSVRASLEWDRFCEIEIPLPSFEEQKKYVSIYNELQKNQSIYESSLDDLQLICNGYMDQLKKIEEFHPIGDFISLVDIRNTGTAITKLRGINVDKNFMPSKANVGESDLSK